jgi:NNP family nitrate/nitrite transporter-like MFS transporter
VEESSIPMTDEIIQNKATRIDLFSLKTRQMRAFHMSWFAFFLCFFAWFGIAPLMVIVRDELGLTKTQIGNTIIASVAVTIVARLVIGWLCDRIGPRITYTWLLLIGSLPVMTIGFADSYYSFLLFRLAIGVIGASFVITQYHTSVMFAPNVVGTANATSAGWGNLGGGVTQMIMPLIFAAFIGLGYSDFWSWRLSMTVAGVVCFGTGIAYYFFTTDLPNGNFKELRASGEYHPPEKIKGSFREAAKDKRVWALFFVYAACFGVELTINNVAALYYTDYFGLGLKTAGLVAGLFGLMNIFARTTGGIIGDKFAARWGLKGRVKWLFIALFVESLALMFFSRMTVLPIAIGSMVIFSLFVQMSEGATYSVVPFINKKALGSVAGIVGAGGNAGAVAAGFLFRAEELTWPMALLVLGGAVMVCSFATLAVTFSPAEEEEAKKEYNKALADRRAAELERAPAIVRPALPELIASLRPMVVLRIYLGVALAIKGIYFIMNMDAFEQLAGTLGDLPTVVAWYVVAAHVVGGAALAIGLGTRFAALVNIPVLIGATLAASTGGLFASDSTLQFTIFVLFVLALFVWQGSGKFSVDQLLSRPTTPRTDAEGLSPSP